MKKSFNLQFILIVLTLLILGQNAIGQVFILKAKPPKDIDTFIISNKIEDNVKSKSLRNKFIYVTDNSSYTTFVPNFRSDSLLYTFPNLPIFTYLKGFDLFVVKSKDKKQILTKDEFLNSNQFKPTNEFKDYFGIKAQKFITETNFYEFSLLVAEGESNIETHPFLKLLNELKLLHLQPNQKVVAMNCLGIEFDIEHMFFERGHGKNINEEVYREDTTEDDEEQKSNYEEILDITDIKHLVNKTYSFDTEQHILYNSYSYNDSADSLNILIDHKTGNTLNIYKNYFTLNLNKNIIRGKLNSDGNLQPETYYKLKDTSKLGKIDLKNFNIISKTLVSDKVELIVQSNNGFWNFYKYVIQTNPKDDFDISTFLLPENQTIKGQIETLISFNASYNRTYYERSSNQEKRKPLEHIKTFFINE